jgi:osmotically-inducible protein OsmY
MRDPMKIWVAALAVAAGTAISGCTSPMVTATAERAGKVFEVRSSDNQNEDAAIASRFLARLAEIDRKLHLDVTADVWEGDVMLTGVIVDERTRVAVVRAARADKAVKTVFDDLRVVSKVARDKRRIERETGKHLEADGSLGADLWIEAKIRAQLVTSFDVRSVNFRWRAVQGQVYVLGSARSQEELDKVIKTVRATENVKGVKPHIGVVVPTGKN